MKKQALLTALIALVLALASCASMGGTSGGGGQGEMDRGGTGGSEENVFGMSDEMEAKYREMVMPSGEYSDRAFIDEMVLHHEGAVEMAEVAPENAEHEEIRALAKDIISSQRTEIETLGDIRQRRFGSAGNEMEGMSGMEGMNMTDPDELAQSDPFDRAFIDAMIPHHKSAIVMAEVAREETKDPEIENLANDIVSAQKREIEQMIRWREEWYPEG